MCWDLLRRRAESAAAATSGGGGGSGGAAPIASRLLRDCHTTAIEEVPAALGREIVAFVTDELAHSSRQTAAAAGGQTGGDERGTGAAGGGRSGASRAGDGKAAGEGRSTAAWPHNRSILVEAGCAVPPCRLLEWIERAVQLRRKGGDDLISSSGAQLKQVLRALSASDDPSLGVHAAKLSALLQGQRRQERSAGGPLLGWKPVAGGGGAAPIGWNPVAAAGGTPGKPASRRSLYTPTGRGKGAQIGGASWASDGGFDSLYSSASSGHLGGSIGGSMALRDVLERDRNARANTAATPPFLPSSAWLD